MKHRLVLKRPVIEATRRYLRRHVHKVTLRPMTQQALARKLGISQALVSMWLTGGPVTNGDISQQAAVRLCTLVGVDPKDAFTEMEAA